MFQRDYILRLIEEAGQALALVLQLRRFGQYQEALAAIDQTMGRLVGVGLAEVEAMPAENLSDLLRFVWSDPRAQSLTPDRFIVLGRLLEEAAEIADAEGYETQRDLRRLKALQLYLAVLTEDDPDSPDAARSMEPLLERLSDYHLPASAKHRLWKYDERRGAFARAEDWLFELLEDEWATSDGIEEGLAFYDRLLNKTDTELEAGNLPREELLAGRAELEALRDSPATMADEHVR